MVEVLIGEGQVERVAYDELHPLGDTGLRRQPPRAAYEFRRQIHADDAHVGLAAGHVHRVLPAAATDVEYTRSGPDPLHEAAVGTPISNTLKTPGAM